MSTMGTLDRNEQGAGMPDDYRGRRGRARHGAYRAFSDDPINRVDPTGLESVDPTSLAGRRAPATATAPATVPATVPAATTTAIDWTTDVDKELAPVRATLIAALATLHAREFRSKAAINGALDDVRSSIEGLDRLATISGARADAFLDKYVETRDPKFKKDLDWWAAKEKQIRDEIAGDVQKGRDNGINFVFAAIGPPHKYAGKTVNEILRGKLGSIKQAPLEEGSPSWKEIDNMTWEEIEAKAAARVPGFKTFKKLLTQGRFDK